MPQVACPECGAHTRVGSENLGRSIECSKCSTRYTAETEPPSWTRFLERKNSAGYYAGQSLLVVCGLCAVAILVAVSNHGTDMYGALFGRGSLPWARGLFWIGLASLLAGFLLILRYRKAKSRWPRR